MKITNNINVPVESKLLMQYKKNLYIDRNFNFNMSIGEHLKMIRFSFAFLLKKPRQLIGLEFSGHQVGGISLICFCTSGKRNMCTYCYTLNTNHSERNVIQCHMGELVPRGAFPFFPLLLYRHNTYLRGENLYCPLFNRSIYVQQCVSMVISLLFCIQM